MIPTKIIFDAATNVYLTSGPIQTGNAPDQHARSPEEWIDGYFEAAPHAYQVRGYRLALEDGLVDDTWEGRLAWLDISNNGKLRSVEPRLYWRDREQSITATYYNALAHMQATAEWPPFPHRLTLEGWASWEDVQAAIASDPVAVAREEV
jgi:hypothetical protein